MLAKSPITSGPIESNPVSSSPATSDHGVLPIRAVFLTMIGTLALVALAMSGLIVFRLVASLQANAEKELESATRDVAYLVDREIAGVTNTLTALAASDDLNAGDIERLHRKSVEVSRQIFPDFFIVLYELHRDEHYFNTRFPFSAPIPQTIAFPPGEAARLALLGGRPALSDVFFGPRVKQHFVIDCVPVREPAGIRFALCGNLSLDLFAETLRRWRREGDGVVTVIDRNGIIVARSKDHDKFSGKPATSLDVIDAGASSGLARGPNAEGVPFVWAFHRMETTGWLVRVGVPRHLLDAPMLFGIGGMLIVTILVVFGAVVIANRAGGPIARSMKELRDAVSGAEQEIHDTAARLRALVDTIVDGVILIDARGDILLFNPASEALFGYGAAEVMGQNVNLLMPSSYRDQGDQHDQKWTGMRRMIDGRHEASGLRKDGSVFPLALSVGEVKRDGESLYVGLIRDLTERRQSQRERDELRRRLMRAQEDERLRLARELHDETGQVLVAAMLDLKRLEPVTDEQGAALLRHLRSQLDNIDGSLHRIARELRPTAIDDLGVAKALADHIAGFSERFGIEVDYHCPNVDLDALPADVGTVLFRICQEALTNIAKHAAGATDIGITVDRSDRMLRLTIEDNGCGFDPAATAGRPDSRKAEGLGIAGMRERLALIGGELLIESSVGVGTTIFVRIALETTESGAPWPTEPA